MQSQCEFYSQKIQPTQNLLTSSASLQGSQPCGRSLHNPISGKLLALLPGHSYKLGPSASVDPSMATANSQLLEYGFD